MDRVSDCVDKFPTETRRATQCGRAIITDCADHLHGQLKRERPNFLARFAEAGSGFERKSPVVFDPWITLAIVIIYFPLHEAFEQTLEMIEAVAVMPTNRRVEDLRKSAGVTFIIEPFQKGFALAKDFDSGLNQG